MIMGQTFCYSGWICIIQQYTFVQLSKFNFPSCYLVIKVTDRQEESVTLSVGAVHIPALLMDGNFLNMLAFLCLRIGSMWISMVEIDIVRA